MRDKNGEYIIPPQQEQYLILKHTPFISHVKMCFGCDEERNGYHVRALRPIDSDIKVVEMACLGCMQNLDRIRQFSIPFAQVDSHEGSVTWAISRKYYERHKRIFREISERYSSCEVDEYPDVITFYDTWMHHAYSEYEDRDKKEISGEEEYSSRVVHFTMTDGGDDPEELVLTLIQAGITENLGI